MYLLSKKCMPEPQLVNNLAFIPPLQMSLRKLRRGRWIPEASLHHVSYDINGITWLKSQLRKTSPTGTENLWTL